MSELTSKRPLMPPAMQTEGEVADVLSTFRMLAELPPDSLGAYVISMAHTASDVLAVILLQVRSLMACSACCQVVFCLPTAKVSHALSPSALTLSLSPPLLSLSLSLSLSLALSRCLSLSLSLSLCVCVCVSVCVLVCVCVCVCDRESVRERESVCACACTCMHACMRAFGCGACWPEGLCVFVFVFLPGGGGGGGGVGGGGVGIETVLIF